MRGLFFGEEFFQRPESIVDPFFQKEPVIFLMGRMAIYRIPPSGGDNPITTLSFDGGHNFVTLNYLDMLLGIGGRAGLNFVGKSDGTVYPVRI